MSRLIMIGLGVLMLATTAGAQYREGSWDNLRTLRAGEKIQVVDQKLKSLNGIFVSVSAEAIAFQAGKDAVTVQRADVFRVSSRERGHSRGRNALVGLAVGAAAGAGFIGAVAAAQGGIEDIPVAAAVAGFAMIFGGVGAGVGAALPSGHPTIYRAQRRKDQVAP